MLRWFSAFLLSWLLSCTAHAGTKVIDVELGVSTLDQVRKIASSSGKVQNSAINPWSQGPTLTVRNGDYGIESLRSVEYIFDSSNKLTAVVMYVGKERFEPIVDTLAGKYKMTRKVQPFVGDQYARFSTLDGLIEVDAPHMEFVMEVRYMTIGFQRAWVDGVKSRETQQRQQEKSKF